MRLRLPHVVTYAAIALGVTLIASAPMVAQEESEQAVPQHKQVLGYQDPQTGVFRPLSTMVPEAIVPPVAGTITVTLHITLKTAVPAGAKVGCTANVLAIFSSTAGSTAYTELAGATATVSGTTATCVLSIPHSWQFPAVTTTDVETLSGGYSAEIFNPTAATATTPPTIYRSSGSAFVALTGNNIFPTAPTGFSVNVTL